MIIFSGTHDRHFFIHQEAIRLCDEVLLIVMKREDVLPTPNQDLSEHEKNLFKSHFESRKSVEDSTYGKLCPETIVNDGKNLYVDSTDLNSADLANKVREFNADLCFIFGYGMIRDPVFSCLPDNKINMHLGLSPWYKGSATLFWPFYFLQPQFAGVTFHQITKNPDAGEIIHQCVPALNYGDTIHSVGAKSVVKAKEDVSKLFDYFKKYGKFDGRPQKTTGRVWRGVDFHASQLRVIYDLFDDKIVDAYLDGHLENRTPKLFSCLA